MTTFLCLALAPAIAQEAKLPKAFVEVARTTARGGNCERILLSGDGKRMLTVGEAGDLLWWDLVERRLLRRIAGKGRFVSASALHPIEPWAVLGASAHHDDDGSVWHCDLATGTVTELCSGRALALRFTAEGNTLHLRLRTGDRQSRDAAYRADSLRGVAPFEELIPAPPVEFTTSWWTRQARSPNGKYHAACEDGAVRCTGAVPRTIHCVATETWLATVAIGDDGTVAAADWQGQIYVRGIVGETTVLAGHAGPAHQIVFSSDGRFLAVVGLGATRVVDLAGNDIAEWQGTCIVRQGPEGADFWILGQHQLRRWSASAGRDVVPPLRWTSPALRTVRPNVASPLSSSVDPNPSFCSFGSYTLGAACVVDGDPWIGAKKFRGSRPWRWGDGAFERVGLEPPPSHFASQLIALEARVDGLVLSVKGRDRELSLPAFSSVALYRDSGASVAAWSDASIVRCFTVDPANGDAVLGFVGNEVKSLDGATLTEVGARQFATDLHDLTFLDRGRVLAAFGRELLLLDAKTLTTLGGITVPADLGRIDVVAVAPTRRHAALAHGSDVRIVRIE